MAERRYILDRENIRCPHCGESYYEELYSTRTSVYYTPIYIFSIELRIYLSFSKPNSFNIICNLDKYFSLHSSQKHFLTLYHPSGR